MQRALRRDVPAEVASFVAGNGQFSLNLAMVSAKPALSCAAGVSGSALVTVIARNGVVAEGRRSVGLDAGEVDSIARETRRIAYREHPRLHLGAGGPPELTRV